MVRQERTVHYTTVDEHGDQQVSFDELRQTPPPFRTAKNSDKIAVSTYLPTAHMRINILCPNDPLHLIIIIPVLACLFAVGAS